jgi:hypothetical protein
LKYCTVQVVEALPETAVERAQVNIDLLRQLS